MSFGGRAASSSGCAIRPRGHETGSTGYIGRTPSSSPTGHYVMATAEHREPCESRGSCTVLGAPGGETPPGDSTIVSSASANAAKTCSGTWGRAGASSAPATPTTSATRKALALKAFLLNPNFRQEPRFKSLSLLLRDRALPRSIPIIHFTPP